MDYKLFAAPEMVSRLELDEYEPEELIGELAFNLQERVDGISIETAQALVMNAISLCKVSDVIYMACVEMLSGCDENGFM